MSDKRKLAVAFHGCVMDAKGDIVVGCFLPLHSYAEAFALTILLEEKEDWQMAASWLNDKEVAWREGRKAQGLDCPPVLLYDKVLFDTQIPAGALVISPRAIPFTETFFSPTTLSEYVKEHGI